MADQSDVETALTSAIAGVLYPNGTTADSVLGAVCRIYRGWPNPAGLDADLTAGRVNVTVYPDARHQRNTTRYPDDFTQTATLAPTLAITVNGASATIAGDAATGQIAGLMVDGMAAVHRTQAGDTPELVAAALAAHISTVRMALASGATVTIPGARLVIGRVVADQPMIRETRRQEQNFRLTFWCPDPAMRDAAAGAVDAALSAIRFLDLADGTQGRLIFRASLVFDQSQNARLYRRDLLYGVDYATTIATTLPSMIFGDASFTPAPSATPRHLIG